MADVYDPEIPTEDQEGISGLPDGSTIMASKPVASSENKAKVMRAFGTKKLLKTDDKPIKFQIVGKKLPLVQYSDDESDNTPSGRSTPLVKPQMNKPKCDFLPKVSTLLGREDSSLLREPDGALVKLATYDSDSGSEKNLAHSAVRCEATPSVEIEKNKVKSKSRWSALPQLSVEKRDSEHHLSASSKEVKHSSSVQQLDVEKPPQNQPIKSHPKQLNLPFSQSVQCPKGPSELYESTSVDEKQVDSRNHSRDKVDKKASPAAQSPGKDLGESRHSVRSKGPWSGMSMSSRHSRHSPLPELHHNSDSLQEEHQKGIAKQQRTVSSSPDRCEMQYSHKNIPSQKTHQGSPTSSGHSQGAYSANYDRRSRRHSHSPAENSLNQGPGVSSGSRDLLRKPGYSHSSHRHQQSTSSWDTTNHLDDWSPSCESSYQVRPSRSMRQARDESPPYQKHQSRTSHDRYEARYSPDVVDSERRHYSSMHPVEGDIRSCVSPEQRRSSRSNSYHHYRKDSLDAYECRSANFVFSKEEENFSQISPDGKYRRRRRGYDKEFQDHPSREQLRHQAESHQRTSKDRFWTSSYDDAGAVLDEEFYFRSEREPYASRMHSTGNLFYPQTEDCNSLSLKQKRSSSHRDSENIVRDNWIVSAKETGWQPKQDKSLEHGFRESARLEKFSGDTKDVRHGGSQSLPHHSKIQSHRSEGLSGKQTKSNTASNTVSTSTRNNEVSKHQISGANINKGSEAKDQQDSEYIMKVAGKRIEYNEKVEEKKPKDSKKRAASESKSSGSSSSETDDDGSSSSSDSSVSSSSSSSSSTSSSSSSTRAKKNFTTKPQRKPQKDDLPSGTALHGKSINAELSMKNIWTGSNNSELSVQDKVKGIMVAKTPVASSSKPNLIRTAVDEYSDSSSSSSSSDEENSSSSSSQSDEESSSSDVEETNHKMPSRGKTCQENMSKDANHGYGKETAVQKEKMKDDGDLKNTNTKVVKSSCTKSEINERKISSCLEKKGMLDEPPGPPKQLLRSILDSKLNSADTETKRKDKTGFSDVPLAHPKSLSGGVSDCKLNFARASEDGSCSTPSNIKSQSSIGQMKFIQTSSNQCKSPTRPSKASSQEDQQAKSSKNISRISPVHTHGQGLESLLIAVALEKDKKLAVKLCSDYPEPVSSSSGLREEPGSHCERGDYSGKVSGTGSALDIKKDSVVGLSTNFCTDSPQELVAAGDGEKAKKQAGVASLGLKPAKDILLVPTVVLKAKSAKVKSAETVGTVRNVSSRSETASDSFSSITDGKPSTGVFLKPQDVLSVPQISEDGAKETTSTTAMCDLGVALPLQEACAVSEKLPQVETWPDPDHSQKQHRKTLDQVQSDAIPEASFSQKPPALRSGKSGMQVEMPTNLQQNSSVQHPSFVKDDKADCGKTYDKAQREFTPSKPVEDVRQSGFEMKTHADEKPDKSSFHGGRKTSPSRDRRSRSRNRSSSSSSRKSRAYRSRSRRRSHRSGSGKGCRSPPSEGRSQRHVSRELLDSHNKYYKDRRKRSGSRDRPPSYSRDRSSHYYRRSSPNYHHERHRDRERYDHDREHLDRTREHYNHDREREYYDHDRRRWQRTPDRHSVRNYSESVDKRHYSQSRTGAHLKEQETPARQHRVSSDLDSIPLPSASVARSSSIEAQVVSGKTQALFESAILATECYRRSALDKPAVDDHNLLRSGTAGSSGNHSDRESIDMELENSDDQSGSVVDSSVPTLSHCSPPVKSKAASSKMIDGKVAFMMKDSGRKPLVNKKKSVFEEDSDNSSDVEGRLSKHKLELGSSSKRKISAKVPPVSVTPSSSSDAKKASCINLHQRTQDASGKSGSETLTGKIVSSESELSRTEVTSSSRSDHKDRSEGRKKDIRESSDFRRTKEWEEKPKGVSKFHSSRFEAPRTGSVAHESVAEGVSITSSHLVQMPEPSLVTYPVAIHSSYAVQSTLIPTRCDNFYTSNTSTGFSVQSCVSNITDPVTDSSQNFDGQSDVSNITVVTDSSRVRSSRFGSTGTAMTGHQECRFMDFPDDEGREGIGVMISGNRPIRRDSRDRIKIERICMVKPVIIAEEKEVSSTMDVISVPFKSDSWHKENSEVNRSVFCPEKKFDSCYGDGFRAKNILADSTKKDVESSSPVMKDLDVPPIAARDCAQPFGNHEQIVLGQSCDIGSCVVRDIAASDAAQQSLASEVPSFTEDFQLSTDEGVHLAKVGSSTTVSELAVNENLIDEIPSPHCCIWEALAEWTEVSVDSKEDVKVFITDSIQRTQYPLESGILLDEKVTPLAEIMENLDNVPVSEKRDKRRRRLEQSLENVEAGQLSADTQQNVRRRSSRLRSKEEKKPNSEMPEKQRKNKKRASEGKAKKSDERSPVSTDEQQKKSSKNLKARILGGFDLNTSLDSSGSSQMTAEETGDMQNLLKMSNSSSFGNIDSGLAFGVEGNSLTPVKPEKVKSRWRRCSELDLNASLPPPPPPQPETVVDSGFVRPVSSLKSISFLASLSEEKTETVGGSLLDVEVEFGDLKFVPDANELQPNETDVELKCEVEEVPPSFEEIPDNIFLSERDMKKSRKEARRMICDCTLPSAEDMKLGVRPCGEDCLNRMLMIECGSRCPCGDLCTNRLFQQHLYAKTKSFRTGAKGWGLQASEDMAPGNFIMEYVGEVLDYKEFKSRTKKYARENAMHHYFMALNADEVIDATQKGNISRFINHSCDPNAETQKWTVNGQLRIGFFIIKPISAGEEITFNYQFESYGQEQMKCYCGASNCRGVIGSDKSTPLKSKRNKEAKQKDKKKKKELFNDSFLEEEIEDMLLRGGLHRKAHVLELNRLMLRAESMEQRLSVLKVLQETKEPACLRLFLEYHGLPLLWSWMVDVPIAANEFKMQILNALKILPINNKTMLKESRVLHVVEKWAQELNYASKDQMQGKKLTAENNKVDETPADGVKEQPEEIKRSESSCSSAKTADSSATNTEKVDAAISEKSFPHKKHRLMVHLQQVEASSSDGEPSESAKTEDTESQIEEESSEADGQNEAVVSDRPPAECTQIFDYASDASHEDDGNEEVDSSKPKMLGVVDLAAELLSEWKSLKEVYKIPKIMVEERKKTEQELDRQDEERLVCRRDSYQGWDKMDRRRRSDESPEFRYGNKRRRPGDDSEEGRIAKTRKVLLPTPQTLTKQERRQQFEAQVKAREEMQKVCEQELLQHQLQRPDSTYQDFYASDASSIAYAMTDQSSVSSYPPDALSAVSFQDVPAVLSYPEASALGYHETVAGVVYDESVSACYDSYFQEPSSTPSTYNAQELPAQFVQPQQPYPDGQSVASASTLTYPQQHSVVVNTSYGQTQSVAVDTLGYNAQPVTSVVDASVLQYVEADVGSFLSQPYVDPSQTSLIYGAHGLHYGQSMYYSTSQGPVLLPQAVGQTYQSPASISSPYVQITSDQSAALQSLQIRQLKQQLEIARRQGPTDPRDPPPPPPSPPKPKAVRLPPNWKTAKDSNGKVYYYHTVTRQTQWDPPALDSGVAGEEGEEDDMDLGTPTNDESKRLRRRTTTAAADTSSEEVAKKIKDQFRGKIAKHIVTYLSPYRRVDCEQGRISGAEDFKHLARKLTHTILNKELKHCRHLEDLEVNENVKGKAKDYVTKYMSKFGPVYKPSAGSP